MNSFGVKTTAETGQCLVQNESFLETSNFKKKVSGLHEFADKRDKRKKMTLTMGMENLKRKMGGALAIIVLKTPRHSKMPILGTLGAMSCFRSLYAPKNSGSQLFA